MPTGTADVRVRSYALSANQSSGEHDFFPVIAASCLQYFIVCRAEQHGMNGF